MADNDSNLEVKLKNVRGSFLHVFKPQKHTDAKSGAVSYSYNGAFLLDKVTDAAQIKLIQETMVKARDAKWPGQKIAIPAERRCLRDGEPTDPDTGAKSASYEAYENKMVLAARRRVDGPESPNPISIIGPRKDATGKFPRLKESDNLIYSGCYVNVIVRIYAFDGSKDGYPNRINCSLEAIQFKAHGEPFGAKGVDADEAFDEEEGEDPMDGDNAVEDDLLG